jgi:cytochrome c5
MSNKISFLLIALVVSTLSILMIMSKFHFGPPRSGSEVFNAFCTSCHSGSRIGAPPVGNHEAWAPRIEKGRALLLEHALNGYNGMPPRGTCGNCSKRELAAAIDYMLGKSGGFVQ